MKLVKFCNKFAPLALLLLLAGCDAAKDMGTAGGPDSISADDLARHISILASDEFGGRGPSSPGEEKTVAYLKEQFQGMGLKPGNGESYFQEVPLVDITAAPDVRLVISGGSVDLEFAYAEDMVVWTERVAEQSAIKNSDLVFVGYGIVAPEYDWNDYAGVNVKGKTVVILINDPGFATQDPELFTGNAMTYYGRWTYKFEEAARQGAAGALIIHQTASAAYGWDTVRNSWTGPQFALETENGNMDRVAIEGWLTEESARGIFGHAGLDLDLLAKSAASRDFRARALGLKASVSVNNTIRHSRSKNVAAILEGAAAPDEYFIYMAHWDHLGTDSNIDGDGIYNGALDNASGTAALLELAEAFAQAKSTPPRRSILFLSVTAEEQGLLGSAHYAEHPLVPLAQTVAGLNMDGINNYGPTRDITISGYGLSDLDRIMEEAATAAGRRVDPDPEPEKGYYYRSDHFELAKKGAPMIYPDSGIDHVEFGTEYGEAQRQKYTTERYHQPTDEFDETWDLSGGVEDVRLYYAVGAAIANGDAWPNWHEGTEFRATRDASRASAPVPVSAEAEILLSAPADEVWAVIGDFNGLPDWSVGVEASSVETVDGAPQRTLTLPGDAGTMVEREVARTETSYTYTIVSGPFPLKNYRSTLSVEDAGDGTSRVYWHSKFEIEGMPAEDAQGMMEGAYMAGLAKLGERFDMAE